MSTAGTRSQMQEEEQVEESAFMSTSGIILVVGVDICRISFKIIRCYEMV